MACPPPPPPLRAQAEQSTRDWSSLDILDCLEVVAKKLRPNSLDYVTFRSVCKTWRSAAPKMNFAPLLMFPICPVTGTLRFFSPSDDRPFSFVVPEVRNKVLCGITRGMLTLMDEDLRMSLINPFTKVAFELPPATPELAAFSGMPVAREAGRWINQLPIHGAPVIYEEAIDRSLAGLPEIFIKEVALSSPPTSNAEQCVAMGVLPASKWAVCCKLGANVWNLINTNLPKVVRSITYYRNKAFIVDMDGNIVTADVDSLPLMTVLQRTPILSCDRRAFRLVESFNGDLLKVTAVISVDSVVDHFEYHYEVHKLVEGDEDIAWLRLEDIGEEVLFISRFHTSHFSGSRVPGCKSNYLYFTEGSPCLIEPLAPDLHHMEIVNVSNGQNELVPCHWTRPRPHEEVCWIKPDLLSTQ